MLLENGTLALPVLVISIRSPNRHLGYSGPCYLSSLKTLENQIWAGVAQAALGEHGTRSSHARSRGTLAGTQGIHLGPF